MKTILFQGDSVTDGEHSREHDQNPGYSYPLFVQEELDLAYPGCYRILNRGIAGNRIPDLYARIKTDILNLKPDILSILIGVNDVWGFFSGQESGTDAEKYYRIYAAMIEEIKEALPDIKIMILEPFILKGEDTEKHWEGFYAGVRERSAMAQKISREYHLHFVPLQETFEAAAKLAPNAYWVVDGIHPTTEGTALIAREWLKTFRELEG